MKRKKTCKQERRKRKHTQNMQMHTSHECNLHHFSDDLKSIDFNQKGEHQNTSACWAFVRIRLSFQKWLEYPSAVVNFIGLFCHTIMHKLHIHTHTHCTHKERFIIHVLLCLFCHSMPRHCPWTANFITLMLTSRALTSIMLPFLVK